MTDQPNGDKAMTEHADNGKPQIFGGSITKWVAYCDCGWGAYDSFGTTEQARAAWDAHVGDCPSPILHISGSGLNARVSAKASMVLSALGFNVDPAPNGDTQ